MQVYFGPRTLDADELLPSLEDGHRVFVGDMDSYAVETLDFFQRRRLEEVAGEVGGRAGYKNFPWMY